MIRYQIELCHHDGYGGYICEELSVKKSELKKYLDEGWSFIGKRYFLITSFIHWWSKFSTTQRISIFTIFLTAFYFFLSMSLDNQYTDLKDKYESLENKQIQLNNTLIITSDSLKVERDLSRLLRKQIVISKNLKKP